MVIEQTTQDFKHQLSLTASMEKHVNSVHEKELIKTKQCHIEKLNRLISKRRHQGREDTQAANKWVCNLSEHTLMEAEHFTLTWSLNYAITPKRILYEEFIVADRNSRNRNSM